MKRVQKLATPPVFISFSAVGGYEEAEGPLGKKFDLCDPSDTFGQKTWEMSEAEMGRLAMNIALTKASLSHTDLDIVIAGDLQNQCVASSSGISSFGVPFIGVYGACSTCTEALLLASSLCQSFKDAKILTLTTSHNSAAERQFRTPLEYGGQRTPSAQWTSTAAGSFILTNRYSDISALDKKSFAAISEVMPGRIIDGATPDSTNMGAAMAFAAADSIISFFNFSDNKVSDFDLIVTGDLGTVGSDILLSILEEKLPLAVPRHADCGKLLYDIKNSDVHAGASGCGTSASVLASHLLPLVESGDIKRLLFLSTGALMSPSSVLQGNNILGIAPAIKIENINSFDWRYK